MIAPYIPSDWLVLLPEIALVVVAVLLAVLDVAYPVVRRNGELGIYAGLGIAATGVLGIIFAQPGGDRTLLFGGMLRADLFAFVFRMLVIFAGAMTALLSAGVRGLSRHGEYFVLLIGACLGMNFMALSADIIMLYLALETTSIAGYVLAGFAHGDDASAEAGLKYFFFGAATSALLVYGLSLLYGFTGETGLAAIAAAVQGGQVPPAALLVINMLLLAGIGFKLAVVPFHFWAPDVYEGAPTPVTAFISTASKAVGFAVLFRIMSVTVSMSAYLPPLLAAISVLSMTLGNLAALAQRNIKRMLAYSSIAHAGYVLMAMVTVSELGTAAVVFYLLTYVVTNLAAFAVVIIFARVSGSDEIADYAGMSRRSPYLALAMLVAFLSLAGVPPLAGFFGKMFLFAAVVQAGLIWLAIVGVLNAIVGIYYYLIVLKVVFVAPAPEGAGPIAVPRVYSLALSVLCIGIIVLGTVAGPWFDIAIQTAQGIY